MKQYIGIKKVNAKPMTRGEYNNLHGRKTPKEENPNDAGFLVKHLDSPNSNHPDFNNYISWSPADVFKRAYTDLNSRGLITYNHTILPKRDDNPKRAIGLFISINPRLIEEFLKSAPEDAEKTEIQIECGPSVIQMKVSKFLFRLGLLPFENDVSLKEPDQIEESGFRKELATLLNRYSMENGSDTPDFILAEYLQNSLNAFDKAVKSRYEWYGENSESSPNINVAYAAGEDEEE